MLTSWWLLALMNELKILAGLLNVLLVAGNLLFRDHYCIFPTVHIFQTMLSCSKSNSQMMKRLFQSRTIEGKRRRRKNRKKNWQLTHYLCRYPWGTSTPTPPSFSSLWLSLCQQRYKIPLSWRLSRDYSSVLQEVGRALRCHITNVVKVIANLIRLSVVDKEQGKKNIKQTNKQTIACFGFCF